jgi:hypothetical protein
MHVPPLLRFRFMARSPSGVEAASAPALARLWFGPHAPPEGRGLKAFVRRRPVALSAVRVTGKFCGKNFARRSGIRPGIRNQTIRLPVERGLAWQLRGAPFRPNFRPQHR